mgnify:FL=1
MVFGLERIRYLEENWRSIAELVLRTARKFADVKEAVVYGSVIKGTASGSSDLDIALIVRNLDVKKVSELLVKIHLALPVEVSEIVDINLIDERDEGEFLKFAEKYVILT